MVAPQAPSLYIKEALASDCATFVASYPFLFLFGTVELQRPRRPEPTAMLKLLAEDDTQIRSMGTPPEEERASTRLVLALRKVQRTFANMITIGRTPNNDLVVPDISISKFHAYFRVPPEGIVADGRRVELFDAFSSNGTWVADRQRLIPKEPALVGVGDVLRFGTVALTLVGAAQLWDRCTGFGS